MAVSIMRLGVVNYHSEAESSSLAEGGRRLTTAIRPMHHSIRNPFSVWLRARNHLPWKNDADSTAAFDLLLESGTPVSFFEFGALRWEQLI
jgi:hypothetical protein